MNKIPKCRSKYLVSSQANNLKPAPKDSNREHLVPKITQKNLKFTSNRQFGKDLTNSVKVNYYNVNDNRASKIVNLADKKAGNNIYIKKHSSASQVSQKTHKVKIEINDKKIRENKSGSMISKKSDVLSSHYYYNKNYNIKHDNASQIGGTKLHSSISFGIKNTRPFSSNNNNSVSFRSSIPKNKNTTQQVINRSINLICSNNNFSNGKIINSTKISATNSNLYLIKNAKSSTTRDTMINSTSHNSYYNHSKSNRYSNKSEDRVKYKIKEAEKVKEFQYQDHKTIANVKKSDSNRIKVDKKESDENKENRTMENIEKKANKIKKEFKIKRDKKEKISIIEKRSSKENLEKKEIKNSQKNTENKEKTIKIKEEKKNNKKEDNNNNDVDSDENEVKIKYFDISNINNVQIPKEYINIIYYNLLKEEEKGIKPMPDYTYMSRQNEINEKMRSILVDWIIDVHFKFGFTDETLFMTISIIDRYLSICQITRTNFQLLGITALMIACKHEEIDLPKIDDFIYITDNAYVKDEVVKMEEDVLSKLNFSFLYPSPIKFFEYLSLHFKFEKKHHMMGKYLMESFLLDVKNGKYKPSIISCACAYIVMKFFKMPNYHDSYNKKFYVLDETAEKYSEHNIKECAKDICLLVDNINKTNYQACSKKYSKPEQEKVSIIIMNN